MVFIVFIVIVIVIAIPVIVVAVLLERDNARLQREVGKKCGDWEPKGFFL